MIIKVILGEPMWRDVGTRHKEIEFPAGSRCKTVSIAQLASRLGVKLSDVEGALLIFVNGKLIPFEETAAFSLKHNDIVELHMMLTGG